MGTLARSPGKVFPKGAMWAGPAWSERPVTRACVPVPSRGQSRARRQALTGQSTRVGRGRDGSGGLSRRPGPDHTGPTGRGGRLGTPFWGGHPAEDKDWEVKRSDTDVCRTVFLTAGEQTPRGKRPGRKVESFSEQRWWWWWWWWGARVVRACS